MKSNLEKEREYERILNNLSKEFHEIDVNRDNQITCEELVRFLKKKVMPDFLTARSPTDRLTQTLRNRFLSY